MLFQVPGWTVPTNVVSEPHSSDSKKRKRPVSTESSASNTPNLDKLVHKLKGAAAPSDEQKRRTNKKTAKEKTKAQISHPKPLMPVEKRDGHFSTSLRPSKKAKTRHLLQEAPAEERKFSFNKLEGTSSGLTQFQQDMKQSLDGARFRLINETLYKSHSKKAHQMLQDDPHIFEDYHVGFRHQVHFWPTNPVQHYISVLSGYPDKKVIADLGCGDAALARALIPKGKVVLSFDLVSDSAYVVEADICSRIPLPGSEDHTKKLSIGEGHVVDVVVCALSLMGVNWPNCIREAWRILKPDGELKIAEVASRFTDVSAFESLITSIGFRLKSKDDSNTHFTLFEFRKVPRKEKLDKEWAKIVAGGSILKPCEYKRR
ncbi:methyltransferase-domain-containing protein [Cyathus striatus]|nr:methyltransferase-domain-containing protein [Cyathus striatus]